MGSGVRMMMIGAALLLAACSKPEVSTSYAPSPYQTVNVHTPGTLGAHCFVQSGARSYSLSTPGSITIERTRDPMDVTCFKGEHLVGNQKVTPTMARSEEGGSASCVSCAYPGSITVAMVLAPSSLAVNLREIH